MRTILGIIIFLIPFNGILAQNLNPSFEISEYLEMMRISTRSTGDSSYYNKLPAPEKKKAQRNFQKYLGDKASIFIKKSLPEFQKPEFIASNHYVRTGNTIVLLPDDKYREKYPDNSETVFMHHIHQPYMELAERRLNNDKSYKFSGIEPF